MRQKSKYHAFISYSHGGDAFVAEELQNRLQRFARPWWRPRSLRIFRDRTDLAAGGSAWPEIERALARSEWFLLVASPASAASPWVRREIQWWMSRKPGGADRFLIALTAGAIVWEGDDFDWCATTALPRRELAGAFAQEPIWADLRREKSLRGATAAGGDTGPGADGPEPLGDLVVADLAAPIRARPKDTMVGLHVRYRRRLRQTVGGVIAVLTALLVGLSYAAAVAFQQRDVATSREKVSNSRQLAATADSLLGTHADVAQLLSVAAYRLDDNPQTRAALFRAVTASPHLVRYLHAPEDISVVRASGDGESVVAGTRGGDLLRWNVATLERTHLTRMAGPVVDVSVGFSGQAVAATDGVSIAYWDAREGAQELPGRPPMKATAVGLSPSGRFVALSEPPGEPYDKPARLAVFDRRDGEWRSFRPRDLPEGAAEIVFPSESSVIFFGSDGALEEWEVRPLRNRTVSTGFFPMYDPAGAISPTGRRLGMANGRTPASVWDRAERSYDPEKPDFVTPIRNGRPTAMAISGDGRRVAVASAGTVYVSDVTAEKTSDVTAEKNGQPRELTGNSSVNERGVVFLGAEGDRLVSASGRTLTLWDLRQVSRISTRIRMKVPWGCMACPGPRVEVRPDGRQFVIDRGGAEFHHADGSPAQDFPVKGQIPLSWSPHGHLILTVDDGAGDSYRVWDGHNRPLGSWKDPAALSIAWSRDSRRVIIAHPSGDITVRDVADGALVSESRALPVSDPDDVMSAVVNPGAMTAGFFETRWEHDGQVWVVDLVSGRRRAVRGDPVEAIGFSGHHFLVQRENGRLDVFDERGEHHIRSIGGEGDPVGEMVTAPRSTLVARQRRDGTVLLVDIADGSTLGAFDLPSKSPTTRTGMALTPDGASLITVTEDDITGQEIGEAQVWDLSTSRWLTTACATVGRDLTAAEWEQYVGTPAPATSPCGGAAARRGTDDRPRDGVPPRPWSSPTGVSSIR